MKKSKAFILAGAICLILFSVWVLQMDSAFAGKASKSGNINIDLNLTFAATSLEASGRAYSNNGYDYSWCAARKFVGTLTAQQAYAYYLSGVTSLPANYEVGDAALLSASSALAYTEQLAHSIPGREASFSSGVTTSTTTDAAGVIPGAIVSSVGGGKLTINVTGSITNTTTAYTAWAYKYISPLVLDMDGNRKLEASQGVWLPHPGEFKSSKTVVFDIDGNGFESLMEWVGPNDGILVEPKADGTVDGTCLFGTTGGYADGYEKLSLRDANKDGMILGNELAGLSVWQDKNQDGIAEPTELQSAVSLGITQLSVKHNSYQSTFVQNGKAKRMWDWWPNSVALQRNS